MRRRGWDEPPRGSRPVLVAWMRQPQLRPPARSAGDGILLRRPPASRDPALPGECREAVYDQGGKMCLLTNAGLLHGGGYSTTRSVKAPELAVQRGGSRGGWWRGIMTSMLSRHSVVQARRSLLHVAPTYSRRSAPYSYMDNSASTCLKVTSRRPHLSSRI